MSTPVRMIRAMGQRQVLGLALVLSVFACGCRKGAADKEDPPAPDEGKGGKATASSSGGGGLSRLLGRETTPGYGWDGQSSSITLDMNTNEAYRRSVTALRAMGFVIKEEASKKEAGKSHIQGAKTDQTQVNVWIEEPAEKPGKALLHVKVSALGDRTGSERVLDEIQAVNTKPAARPAPKPAAQPKASGDAKPPANSQQP